jgi:hypothetical protein
VVSADVNGDGMPDLISVNSRNLMVSMQKGSRHFAPPVSYPACGGTDSITAFAAGDFNGDGKLDIVVATSPGDGASYGETPSINVLFGTGKGAFSTFQKFYNLLSYQCYSLAVGVLTGSGRQDIVAGVYDGAAVLLNTGGGSFQAGQSYGVAQPIPPQPYSKVALGDFNADGKLDLAVTGSSTVSVLLGNGDGTFGAEQAFDVSGSPAAVAVGDVNGDGKLDIVTANNGRVSVLPGNGDGTFGAATTYAIAGSANSIALADFNQDGKLDIVTTGAEMDVLLNNGDGTFGTAQKAGPAGSNVIVADFNSDGFPDLAQIDASGSSIDVRFNKADWTSGGKKNR